MQDHNLGLFLKSLCVCVFIHRTKRGAKEKETIASGVKIRCVSLAECPWNRMSHLNVRVFGWMAARCSPRGRKVFFFVHVILSNRTKWCDYCCRCASCHSKRRGLHGRQCRSLYFIVPSGLHLIALGSRTVASPAPSPGLIDSPWQWLCSSERKNRREKKGREWLR